MKHPTCLSDYSLEQLEKLYNELELEDIENQKKNQTNKQTKQRGH